MIECYGASRPQKGHSANEDAFLIERDPVPYAALFDGAGNAERAAHAVLRLIKLIIKDQSSKVADPAAWAKWVKLMDSHLMGSAQSTFVGVAVPDEVNGSVVGAYAGDSRAYVIGEGSARLVTTESSPARLGSGRVKAVTIRLTLRPRDVLLLMSDGAWTPLGGTYLLKKAVVKAAMDHFSAVPQAVLDVSARTGQYDDMTVVALRRR
jgi:serine/threonine protein phosphatase PrpC